MGYYFEDPDKLTFKAIRFNGQIFARGRGLFIYIMKYYPQMVEQSINKSRSKVEWTPENFAKATQGMKTHFKGIKFDYVDVSKEYRPEIKELSKVGEGWWPERSTLPVPGVDYPMTFPDFMLNYEKPPKYIRRLGRGMNISNEERLKYQTGVEFTLKGFFGMQRAYRKISGSKKMFVSNLPAFGIGYYHLPQLAREYEKEISVKPVDWMHWRMRTRTSREEFLENAGRQISE